MTRSILPMYFHIFLRENTANSTNDVEIVMDSSDSEDDGEEDLVEYKVSCASNTFHNTVEILTVTI